MFGKDISSCIRDSKYHVENSYVYVPEVTLDSAHTHATLSPGWSPGCLVLISLVLKDTVSYEKIAKNGMWNRQHFGCIRGGQQRDDDSPMNLMTT